MPLYRKIYVKAMIIALLVLTGCAGVKKDRLTDEQYIEHGKYLVRIAGCNDCHTSGYLMAEGKIPENEWLMGDQLGWKGPWGTTYAINLRLFVDALSEDQWIQIVKTSKARPPMPWWALHEMTDKDVRAIYRYLKHLGAAGKPAPAYLSPDQEPTGPYVPFPSPHDSQQE